MKTKQTKTSSNVDIKKHLRTIIETIIMEAGNKQNALLKMDITTLSDGSVEIWCNGNTITLPSQQHVDWLKRNL